MLGWIFQRNISPSSFSFSLERSSSRPVPHRDPCPSKAFLQFFRGLLSIGTDWDESQPGIATLLNDFSASGASIALGKVFRGFSRSNCSCSQVACIPAGDPWLQVPFRSGIDFAQERGSMVCLSVVDVQRSSCHVIFATLACQRMAVWCPPQSITLQDPTAAAACRSTSDGDKAVSFRRPRACAFAFVPPHRQSKEHQRREAKWLRRVKWNRTKPAALASCASIEALPIAQPHTFHNPLWARSELPFRRTRARS